LFVYAGDVLRAAGGPNEYNTATFISYSALLGSSGVFSRFFNDPKIQTILHTRHDYNGKPLPGSIIDLLYINQNEY
jgi:hypothetical protein